MARKSMKSSKPTTFCSQFPLDLLGQVLGRLPVKTLLQFRSASKKWRCLIDSSDFASLHFTLYNNTRQNSPLFLIEKKMGIFLSRCFTRGGDTFRKISQVDSPKVKDSGCLLPVDYANSFVLYCKLDGGKVVVLVHPHAGGANDYKLAIIRFDQRMETTVLIEVYSFNMGSWTSCSIDFKCATFLMDLEDAVPMNGTLHWIECNPQNKPYIVVFDVQNDALSYFYLPAAENMHYGGLFIVHETLALVMVGGGGYHIWVMEHYGRDESYFNTGTGQGVDVCDIESWQIQSLAKSYKDSIVFMDTFVEILASPPGGHKELEEP